MNNLPPEVQVALNFLYGPDKWYRVWAMVMTGCLVFAVPRPTRRLAWIGFISIGCMAFIWNFLQNAYKQYTPDPLPSPKARTIRR